MTQIRRRHHEDLRELLDSDETVAEWGRPIRLYSWLGCTGRGDRGHFLDGH